MAIQENTMRAATRPLRVSFASNAWDKKVIKLARQGFSAKTIASETGLSLGRVSYRLQRGDVSLMSWRRGQSDDARKALARYDRLLGSCRELRERVERLLAARGARR